MKITVNAVRMKQKEKIIEIFTWNPIVSLANDTHRQLHNLISFAINTISMHKKEFKLLDIEYNKNNKIYVYNYKNEYIEKAEQISFNYFPVLGKKSCNRCQHFRSRNKINYCNTKGIKIHHKSNYKCLYWIESGTDALRRKRNVHNQRRSKTYDRANERISTTF